MKRYERDGRWVEVGKLRSVFFEGKPCYEIDGRGDLVVFLGDLEPLYMSETPAGWTIGYRPGDNGFDAYAAFMAAHGEWK